MATSLSTDHMWAKWVHNPWCLKRPLCPAQRGNQKELLNPCHLGGPHVGQVATPPLPSPGPRRPMEGGNQKRLHNRRVSWPTCGQSGYLPIAVSEVPNARHGQEISNGYSPLPSRKPPPKKKGWKSI